METTTNNLQGFIAEIVQELRGMFPKGSYIPDNPKINPGTFPFVSAYTTTGTSLAYPAGLSQTELSDVTIACVVPLDDIAKAVDFFMPYWEQIPIAMTKRFIKTDTKSSKHAQTIGQITKDLGPVEWPQGQMMFGYMLTISDVKIVNEV